jgi:hypothetical protein
MQNKNIYSYLGSEDPLCEDAFNYLLSYREEDSLIDYKEILNNSEEDWLKLTKDIVSFANMEGGYLLLGVRDKTFEPVGVPQATMSFLNDSDKILQKTNRFIDPKITGLRCKGFCTEGKCFLLLYVPNSKLMTHIFCQDGKFKYPSGEEKVVFRAGTIWIRKSGGNKLADARDLDSIFNKRMEYFRDSLLQKIARVVEAPVETEVVLVRGSGEGSEKKFIITDAPDAMPIKGMSFSVSPTTLEEEIAAWIALSGTNPDSIPPPATLWKWYGSRKSIGISKKQKVSLAKFCLSREVPFFYWLQGADEVELKKMIIELLSRGPAELSRIMRMAAYLGKGFYGEMIRKLGKESGKLPSRMKKYPSGGPREWNTLCINKFVKMGKGSAEKEKRREIEQDLERITEEACKFNREPGAWERHYAQECDCFLYAQEDKYST